MDLKKDVLIDTTRSSGKEAPVERVPPRERSSAPEGSSGGGSAEGITILPEWRSWSQSAAATSGGSAALAESRRAYRDLVTDNRRRVVIVGVLGFAIALAALSIGLSLFNDTRTWDADSLSAMVVAAGVAYVTIIVAASMLFIGSRLERRARAALDPVVQDGVFRESLEEGPLWSNGTVGRFLHRSTLRSHIESATLANRSHMNLVGRRRSSRIEQIVSVAADLAIDRWCEIGLILAAPLADEREQRFLLSGDPFSNLRFKPPADREGK